MDNEIEPAPKLRRLLEDCIDGAALGHVAMPEHLGAQLLGERANPLFQRVALIGESQFRAGVSRRFSDPPGNRAIVRHAEYDAAHSAHHARRDAQIGYDQTVALHQSLSFPPCGPATRGIP